MMAPFPSDYGYHRKWGLKTYKALRRRGWATVATTQVGMSRPFRSRWRWLAMLRACLWVYRCPDHHFDDSNRIIVLPEGEEMPR